MYNVRNMQTMSSDPLRVSDVMLDSLTHQLREAESRRAEAERAHQDALTQLRSMSSSGIGRMSEPIETMQSRARELEKKAALETVKCEELQLELSAARKAKSASSAINRVGVGSGVGTTSGIHSSSVTATGYNPSSSSMIGGGTTGGGGSTVTWAPTPTQHPQQGSEIDRIMAKIEQDNLILAELEHPRTTGPSKGTSTLVSGLYTTTTSYSTSSAQRTTYTAGLGVSSTGISSTLTSNYGGGLSGIGTTSSALGGTSALTGLSSGLTGTGTGIGGTSSNLLTSGYSSIGVTSSTSSYGIADATYTTGTMSGSLGTTGLSAAANVSPLPIRANAISSMPPICQSNTMPVLSMHNTYTLPSGSASYTLGLSGAPGAASYTLPTVGTATGATGLSNYLSGTGTTGLSSVLGTGGTSGLSNLLGGTTGLSTGIGGLTSTGFSTTGLTGLSGVTGLTGTGLSNTLQTNLGLGTNTSYSTYTNPLLTSGLTSKLKTLDDLDLSLTRYQHRSSPCSPIPPIGWELDRYGIDPIGTSFMHSQSRPISRIGVLDLDTRPLLGLTSNGLGEPQVDMLDIPGKGRCCVFIAKFSYDPPDMDGSEAELSICAGDYLLVWGNGEPAGGYYDAELLDGRRGLVPASFVQRLVGDDLLEFHQAVVSTLRETDDMPIPLDPAPMAPMNNMSMNMNNMMMDLHHSEHQPHPDEVARLKRETQITDLNQVDHNEDESDNVPAPRHLTLERQLNKSVLIGWTPPDPAGYNQIESYHVYVDGVLKVTVKATERTRALVEGVDCNRPHRISVRSVTQTRRTSRDAACTMIIGRETSQLGPSSVRATNITCSSAIISWLPANSNHQHVVCVNNVEVRTVKPGVYRHTITGLSPSTQYRVTVRAKQLRAPGQAQPPAPPQEEAPGAYTDFRTLAKGLPDPPQDIQVEAGPQDGTLLVTWQPVTRPPSSGPVTGYAVYADGKKVTDVDSPTGDHALIDIGKLVGLNPRAVTVRTKSRDSQSADSQPTPIPNIVRAAARRVTQQQGMGMMGQPGHLRQQQVGQHGPRGPVPGMPPHMQDQQQMLEENLSDKEMYPGQGMHGTQQHGQMSAHPQPNQSGATPSGSTGAIPAIEITKDAVATDAANFSDESEYIEGVPSQATAAAEAHRMLQRRKSSVAQQQILQQQQQQQQQQQTHQSGTVSTPQGYNQQGPRGMMSGVGRPGQPMTAAQQQQQQQQQPYGPYSQTGPTTNLPGQGGMMQPGQQQQPGMMGQQTQPGMPGGMQQLGMQGSMQQPGMQGSMQQPGMQPVMPGMQQNRMGQPNQMGGVLNQMNQPQNPMGPNQMGVGPRPGGPQPQPRAINQQQQAQLQQKKPRYFMAMFDYDPTTMSPNPDGCEEELAFQEGDTIKIFGDKDADGFYWGELRGRRGFVPHNMVTEMEEGAAAAAAAQGSTGMPTSVRGVSRDRWGDIYANMPVKRMIALYDYDPQELSPNVDAEQVELSFQAGAVILVYGEMDEDGFFMGEIDGVRGLVPSNFLSEAPDQYGTQAPTAGSVAQRQLNSRGRGIGPGARGPPPPPRDNMGMGMGMGMGMNQRGGPQRKDARPSSPTLLDNTGHPAPDHQTQMKGPGGLMGPQVGTNYGQQQGQQGGMMQGGMMQNHQQQQQQQMQNQQMRPGQQQQSMGGQPQMQQHQQPQATTASSTGGLGGLATGLFSSATNAAFGNKQQPQKGVPQVVPQPGMTSGPGGMMGQQQQQPMMGQPHQQQQQQSHGPLGGFSPFGGGQQQQQQQQMPGQPGQPGQPGMPGASILGKLTDMTAPGGDMLSKGKELIFMKFGLGGK